uniref:Uncharacterized protein n=1 Tax=Rhizophora mucronata TaxID=61149 RepID=A0A2P2QUA0_RHIMU
MQVKIECLSPVKCVLYLNRISDPIMINAMVQQNLSVLSSRCAYNLFLYSSLAFFLCLILFITLHHDSSSALLCFAS